MHFVGLFFVFVIENARFKKQKKNTDRITKPGSINQIFRKSYGFTIPRRNNVFKWTCWNDAPSWKLFALHFEL